MGRKPVLVQFTEELLARLDRFAEETDRSRSAIVREAVERYVTRESEAEKDRRMIEGYTRYPPGEFNEWAEEGAKRLVDEEPW